MDEKPSGIISPFTFGIFHSVKMTRTFSRDELDKFLVAAQNGFIIGDAVSGLSKKTSIYVAPYHCLCKER